MDAVTHGRTAALDLPVPPRHGTAKYSASRDQRVLHTATRGRPKVPSATACRRRTAPDPNPLLEHGHGSRPVVAFHGDNLVDPASVYSSAASRRWHPTAAQHGGGEQAPPGGVQMCTRSGLRRRASSTEACTRRSPRSGRTSRARSVSMSTTVPTSADPPSGADGFDVSDGDAAGSDDRGAIDHVFQCSNQRSRSG